MRDFWAFYQNIEELPHPFRMLSFGHGIYVAVILLLIVLCFRKYRQCSSEGKRKWQRGLAYYLFIQEMFFYAWTYFLCKENVVFEVLQLELCTVCLFVDFSTLFHNNKQVRFFGALIGMIGGPIAMLCPATVADVYPVFSYRMFNFFMTHGAYILFSLMLLEDMELLNRERLLRHLGIMAGLLTFVYLFDRRFGTQYMFVGTPPKIGIIRMVYDAVGDAAFLPTAIVIFSAVQILMYFVVKKVRVVCYPEEEVNEQKEDEFVCIMN